MNRLYVIAIIAILSGVTLATCQTPASAQITNGSFETTQGGDGFHIADWKVTGGAAALTSSFGDSPTDGAYQAFITNDNIGSTAVNGVTGDDLGPSVGFAQLLNSIGASHAPYTLYGNTIPDDGSAISESINVVAGDNLSFDYDFLTQEDPNAPSYGADYNDDYSFFSTGNNIYALADSYTTNTNGIVEPLPGPSTVSPSNTDYLTETGYQTYDYTFTQSGTYTIAFGVVNGLTNPNSSGANEIDSSLLIDNVQLTAPAAAPETGSGTALFIVLLCGVSTVAALRILRKNNPLDSSNS